MYSLTPRLPFWLQVPIAVTALGTVAAMQEAPRAEVRQRVSHTAQAWRIIRHTLLHHARLRTTMALSVTLGLSTFVMVWLIQPYMQSRGIPEPWFGPLWAAAHLYLAVVSLLSARAAERIGPQAVLLACCLLVAVGYGALAFSTSAAAVAFYLCFMTIRGLHGPILINVLQRDAPEDARASVLSLNALLFRLGFAIIGPPVGMLVDRLRTGSSAGVARRWVLHRHARGVRRLPACAWHTARRRGVVGSRAAGPLPQRYSISIVAAPVSMRACSATSTSIPKQPIDRAGERQIVRDHDGIRQLALEDGERLGPHTRGDEDAVSSSDADVIPTRCRAAADCFEGLN